MLLVIVCLGLVIFTGCAGSPTPSSPPGSGTATLSSASTGIVASSTTTSAKPTPSTSASAAQPSTSSSALPPTVSTLIEGPYRATTVVQGLRVPWEMRFLPDGRLLMTERGGRVVLADADSGAVSEVGRIEVAEQGEAGLLGLALDPDFPRVPAIYVTYTYTEDGGIRNRVSRFELTGLDGGVLNLGRERVLVNDIPAGTIHDGSRVAFGPDGYLWVTMGDAGQGARAQRKDSLSGKVLRMTTEGQPAPDNPFLDLPHPFSLIYTLGHRNPQGIAFHPFTGVAYITEHGPDTDDEVNRLQPGGNYGWPDLRGKTGRPGFTDPMAAWTPTIAPAACIFYTGSVLADLSGTFLFVTLKESDLRVLIPSEAGDFQSIVEERVLVDGRFGRLRAIAQGPDGALYIATSNRDGRGNPRPLDDRVIRIDAADR